MSAPSSAAAPGAVPTKGGASSALVLIDGHALYHRSFHAYDEKMTTISGEPTNAVFGFTRMLLDVLRIIHPEYLIVTFDRPFAYYAVHRPTGLILVAGWVTEPAEPTVPTAR